MLYHQLYGMTNILSLIKMCLIDTLLDLFGYDVTTQIANRHRGGANNRKGNDFETRYAVFLIAKYAHSRFASFLKLIRMHSPSSFSELEPYLDTGNIS